MRGYNPYDEANLTMDLLERLLHDDATRPESVPVPVVVDWFAARDRELAREILEDLTADPGAPVDYVSPAETEIWLLDERATREYVADLRENPPWFDADD